MNRKEFVLLSIIIFLTVVVWIVLGILHVRRGVSEGSVQYQDVVPLTPVFDDDIIRSLSTRKE